VVAAPVSIRRDLRRRSPPSSSVVVVMMVMVVMMMVAHPVPVMVMMMAPPMVVVMMVMMPLGHLHAFIRSPRLRLAIGVERGENRCRIGNGVQQFGHLGNLERPRGVFWRHR